MNFVLSALANLQTNGSTGRFNFLQKNREYETLKIEVDRDDEGWLRCRELAEKAMQVGDLLTAERMWIAALRETAFFEETDIRLVMTLDRISDFYRATRNYDQCEVYCVKALMVMEKRTGTRIHRNIANCLNDLAEVYYAKGQYELAEPLCLEVLSVYQKLSHRNNADIGFAIANLAMLYHASGKHELAEVYYLWTIRHQIEVLNASCEALAILLDNYKNMRARMNQEGTLSGRDLWSRTHHDLQPYSFESWS
jgi:tetratricopeptide (TPR) repeat protein